MRTSTHKQPRVRAGVVHLEDVDLRGIAAKVAPVAVSAIGGGLDYKLIKGVAWRAQMDSIHTHFFGSAQNDLRFSTGILFRF